MNEVNRDVRAAWLAGEKVYQMMSTLMSQMQNLIGFNNEKLSSHWGFSRRGMHNGAADEKGILGRVRSDRQNSIDSALSDHCAIVVFLSMFFWRSLLTLARSMQKLYNNQILDEQIE